MSPDQKDRDLRRLFGDLKAEDRERSPDFRTMMARVRAEASATDTEVSEKRKGRRRLPRRVAWGGTLLAAAAAAIVLLLEIEGTSDSEFVHVVQAYSANPAAGAWKSPTDRLLDLPGSEILSTVPSVGGSPWLSAPGSTPRKARPVRSHS